jgi:hypothetical protein
MAWWLHPTPRLVINQTLAQINSFFQRCEGALIVSCNSDTHTVSAATLSAVTDSTFSVKDLSLQHRLRDTIELRAQVVEQRSVRRHELGLTSEERLLLASSLDIAEHSVGNASTVVESAQREWIELAGSERQGETRQGGKGQANEARDETG